MNDYFVLKQIDMLNKTNSSSSPETSTHTEYPLNQVPVIQSLQNYIENFDMGPSAIEMVFC